MLSRIKKFDTYGKIDSSVRVRTYSGALVSVVSYSLLVYLFISELSSFLEPKAKHELRVDTSTNEKLKIEFDFTFPHLPCAYLSLDAMDVSGDHQLDIMHNVFKKRLDQDGNPIEVLKEEVIGTPVLNVDKKRDGGSKAGEDSCGSCYGAEMEDDQCCNTCEDVRKAYNQRGWAFSNPSAIKQCIDENWVENLMAQQSEGCQVYGYLLVKKVAGNFHISPGKSFQHQQMHFHDMQPLRWAKFDLSHRINKLSFGKNIGVPDPLDGVEKTSNSSVMYQYFAKIVPTTVDNGDGRTTASNLFTVTEYTRQLGDSEHAHGLPGVFIVYDLSPVMVFMGYEKKSFLQFLTGVFAGLGGVYTVAALIDSFLFHSVRAMKMAIGKGH